MDNLIVLSKKTSLLEEVRYELKCREYISDEHYQLTYHGSDKSYNKVTLGEIFVKGNIFHAILMYDNYFQKHEIQFLEDLFDLGYVVGRNIQEVCDNMVEGLSVESHNIFCLKVVRLLVD